MPGFENLFLAFDFLLPFSVNNHCYFVLFVLVFFLVIMCLQNIKSPQNYNNKENQPRQMVLETSPLEQAPSAFLF